VLARKPAMLRMIGLLPIVRNRAFDMVSNGENFKLWIRPRTGLWKAAMTSRRRIPRNALENMRPQFIYDACC